MKRNNPLGTLPEPKFILSRMGALYRELRLLRRLLKLAQAAKEEKERLFVIQRCR